MIEGQEETSVDIETEMSEIVLAGMNGSNAIKSSIVTLCGMFNVESTAPEPKEVIQEMQTLYVDYIKGQLSDEERDARLKPILAKALICQDPLNTPQ
jgi:hypothetical protein